MTFQNFVKDIFEQAKIEATDEQIDVVAKCMESVVQAQVFSLVQSIGTHVMIIKQQSNAERVNIFIHNKEVVPQP